MSRRSVVKDDRGYLVDVVGALRTDRLLLTEQDAARLRATLARASLESMASADARGENAVELLATALRSAIVVPPDRIPAEVVTMRSRLVLEDVASGARREVVLVYPEEERTHEGHVSVLSPVGVALLGLSEGALVGWPLPSGRTAVLQVESVQYQPEAVEEFHL
ncbi:nucleoside diphosphate kinase regulator [Anaeromyxobacter sp. Fw109-5]|uniref:nucleoside diphosphate kinase regulator n=1 Tax=Anaeromyxobacter sp. (strain Fw109-5) TaxID=404589 RepID=UPI0000ED89F8|nr:nucleoside diphosphate kinase regulator [Anaeromyxobacter sp. Fw109-5]ABS27437.1 GreA/GreB family elongation factor [Anaeromyxobacter sp. Fw109-5]